MLFKFTQELAQGRFNPPTSEPSVRVSTCPSNSPVLGQAGPWLCNRRELWGEDRRKRERAERGERDWKRDWEEREQDRERKEIPGKSQRERTHIKGT